MPVFRLEIEARSGLVDAAGEATARRLRSFLGIDARVRTRRVYLLDLEIDEGEAATILDNLVDPIAEVGALGMLADPAAGEAIVAAHGGNVDVQGSVFTVRLPCLPVP